MGGKKANEEPLVRSPLHDSSTPVVSETTTSTSSHTISTLSPPPPPTPAPAPETPSHTASIMASTASCIGTACLRVNDGARYAENSDSASSLSSSLSSSSSSSSPSSSFSSAASQPTVVECRDNRGAEIQHHALSAATAFTGWSSQSAQGKSDASPKQSPDDAPVHHCELLPGEDLHQPMPSPLKIFPFVAEYRSDVMQLVPLVDCGRSVALPRRMSNGDTSGSGSGTSHRYGKEFKSNATDGYMTTKGRMLVEQQQQTNGCSVSESFSVSRRIIEKVHSHYDISSDTFTAFTQADTKALFNDFCEVAGLLCDALRDRPPVVHLSSPVFCCGDLHGSFSDMKTVFTQVSVFGNWALLSMPVLLLGDYVDRGAYCVELVLTLFARALVSPSHVRMLRGNHEDREINGDEASYGTGSFLYMCKAFFGPRNGSTFWELANQVFELLPIAAVIDGTVFACHGGVPLLRASREDFSQLKRECNSANAVTRRRGSGSASRVSRCENTVVVAPSAVFGNVFYDWVPTEEMFAALLTSTTPVPAFRFATVLAHEADEDGAATRRRLVRELLWNDPAPKSDEFFLSQNPDCPSLRHFRGFRCNRGRGDDCGTIREFNQEAIERFFSRFGFSLLIRAHQQKPNGVEMIQGGRIITLFSCCNYDHYERNRAGACIIVNGEVKLISWYSSKRNTSAQAQPHGLANSSLPPIPPQPREASCSSSPQSSTSSSLTSSYTSTSSEDDSDDDSNDKMVGAGASVGGFGDRSMRCPPSPARHGRRLPLESLQSMLSNAPWADHDYNRHGNLSAVIG